MTIRHEEIFRELCYTFYVSYCYIPLKHPVLALSIKESDLIHVVLDAQKSVVNVRYQTLSSIPL